MIRITSKKDGFRRCGIQHSSTTTEYPDYQFSPAALKALQAEPMLVVEVIGSAGKPATAADVIALAQTAESHESLDQLADGETRKTVLDAIAKRRTELPPAE